MLTLKQGIKLSAIVDKMEITIDNPTGSKEQVGADLIKQLLCKAHRAENEIIQFVAEVKKITPGEAANIDLIQFVKDMVSDGEVLSFFKSAVK